MTDVVATSGLGKRYGKTWALRDCSLTVPSGRVVALVGPNGAGKTTLLKMMVGLATPSAGTIQVLGRPADRQSVDLLQRVGFVAQETPLYRSFTVSDMLSFGVHMNADFDRPGAVRRLERLEIPMDRTCGTMSGGQQAQIALAIALAKRPELLVLDEPVARLDPLARREFLETLMEAVADGDLSVVLSSHLVADLEHVCDHLIVLTAGQIRLAGNIDELLAEHHLVSGVKTDEAVLAGTHEIVEARHTERQTRILVRGGPIHDDRWETEGLGLEELVLAYLRRGATPPRSRDVAAGAAG